MKINKDEGFPVELEFISYSEAYKRYGIDRKDVKFETHLHKYGWVRVTKTVAYEDYDETFVCFARIKAYRRWLGYGHYFD